MAKNLDAVKANDRRQALITLLETLAYQLDTTESAIHAQLAAQYRAAWADLAELDAATAPQEESELDRIRRERATRGGTTTDRPRAAGRRK